MYLQKKVIQIFQVMKKLYSIVIIISILNLPTMFNLLYRNGCRGYNIIVIYNIIPLTELEYMTI